MVLSGTCTGIGGAALGSSSTPAYDPGMMTFDGSTGYYNLITGIATSGNKSTLVARFNRASFTGARETLAMVDDGSNNHRIWLQMIPSDDGATGRRNKIMLTTESSGGALLCLIISSTEIMDGADHIVMASFDGDAGAVSLIIDGVDEDDTGNGDRQAPSVGTLGAGASSRCAVGAIINGASNHYGGDLGFYGYDDTYITNHGDFMATSVPIEIDETGWTEWGTQPLFWNTYGTMTDNKGSASNMSASGTISGPA